MFKLLKPINTLKMTIKFISYVTLHLQERILNLYTCINFYRLSLFHGFGPLARP